MREFQGIQPIASCVRTMDVPLFLGVGYTLTNSRAKGMSVLQNRGKALPVGAFQMAGYT